MNNIRKFITGLSTGLFFISGTLLAEPQPDWVEGDAGFYPNDKYMTATGSASNAELAKNRALGNLSKIFETHIKESSTTHSDTNVSIDNGSESFTKKHRIAQQIQVRTDKIINGARIAETWKDDSLFTYHSLAVLDRLQAANNIKSEMSRLDGETQVMLDRSENNADVLFSLSALDKAVALQFERYTLQKTLKVIDTRGKGSPAKWNLAELKSKLENKLQKLEIATAVDNDPIGKLHQSLKSAMGNAGFPAGNGSTGFTLVANLDVQDLGFRQGWYWLRGKLSVKMVEANGRIRGRKQWALKVSALQHNDAESRLMTQVAKRLNTELKPAILEFATGVK
ncbi:MAG: LPP20 family lipoprotein [Gammaproteobacteria bacterium]|nr:LPP20 family lipoprotein [Gammaproteobacteria bacterium]